MVTPRFIPKLRRKNSSGTYYIYIEVYLNRNDYTFFSTGIEVEARQFKKGLVVQKEDAWKLNRDIKRIIGKLEEIYETMAGLGRSITSKDLVRELKGSSEPDHDPRKNFNQFFKLMVDELEGVEKSDTLRDKRQSLAVLNSFNPNLGFREITNDMMYDFVNYLKRHKYAEATRHKHKKNINWAINLAKRKRLIDPLVEPWAGLDVKRPEGTREALSLEELARLEALVYNDPLQQKILDAFLFSCYTGMRFSDVQQLSSSNIQVEEGETFVRMTYAKTKDSSGADVELPVGSLFEGKPLAILNRYAVDGRERALVFPSMFNARVNEELKVFAREAGITKNLTFHMARHTFGTSLARLTNDVVLIKKLMGIRKTETAMVYIHMNREVTREKVRSIKWTSAS